MSTSASQHARASDRPILGIALMALAVTILPMMDGIAKYLTADYSVFQITWARYASHLLWMLPVLMVMFRPRDLVPANLGMQLLRSSFLLATTLCYFAAVTWLPLADVLALLLIGPMVCTMLAPWLLREHVGIWRWSAVIAGFIGALIMIRPGFAAFHWASLLAVAAGVFFGGYLVTTRRLSGSANPVITLFFTAVVGSVVLTFTLPLAWVTPTPAHAGLMLLMGLFGAIAHFMMIKALERAPAPVVTPIAYVEIVSATIIGLVVFGDFPDFWTWIGIVVIISSGVIISVREGRKSRRSRAPIARTH